MAQDQSAFFAESILKWHYDNPRALPWKETDDPYKIWLSEIILQQTQVVQGIPYYNRFVSKYPTVHDLASATEDEILNDWQGLGYNSRARNLHRAAITVAEELGGYFPDNYNGLLELHGVGPYTAAAIASFAYGERVPVIDANVIRILCRFLGIDELPSKASVRKLMISFLSDAISECNPADFNQAIMNFGALVCTPRRPSCTVCPIRDQCYAARLDIAEELPVKPNRKPRRDRFFHYLVIADGEGLVLKKRQENDIWRGMYDFPVIETSNDQLIHDSDRAAILKGMAEGLDLELRTTSTDSQVLSHQRIHCIFYECPANNLMKMPLGPGYVFVPFKNLHTFAVPKVIDCYFKANSIFL